MTRTISAWIEVPQTAPADGAPRPRRPRRRAVRVTIATVPAPARRHVKRGKELAMTAR